MLITKHCKPVDQQRMLEGHFKIGSHGEYSAAEGTGLLSDNAEGDGGTVVDRDLRRFTGEIAGIKFINATFHASMGNTISFRHRINCLIFCASMGPYKPDRHQRLMSGSSDYSANPETSAYLVLDAEKIQSALRKATDELFGVSTKWVFRPVVYGERIVKVSGSTFSGLSESTISKRQVEQAFTKPPNFAVEEELRFVMIPDGRIAMPARFFTSELSASVQEAFKETILDAGQVDR